MFLSFENGYPGILSWNFATISPYMNPYMNPVYLNQQMHNQHNYSVKQETYEPPQQPQTPVEPVYKKVDDEQNIIDAFARSVKLSREQVESAEVANVATVHQDEGAFFAEYIGEMDA